MSYPRDIDEISEPELIAELRRRILARRDSKCDYCGRPCSEADPCKFPDRHKGGSVKGIHITP